MKRAIPFGFLLILGFSLAFDRWGGRLMDLGLEHTQGEVFRLFLSMGMVDGALFVGSLFIIQRGFPTRDRKPLATWVLAGYIALAALAGVELTATLFRTGWDLGAVMKIMDTHPEQIQRWIVPGWLPVPKLMWVARSPWMHLLNLAVIACILAPLLNRLDRQQREAERLEAEARRAREHALRAKLAPHFIFNTLNTLHAQIAQDPHQAQATTEKLAQVFRQVVQVSDAPTIALRQELSFVEAYLGIEQARLGERLHVRIEVPEELESIEIPPLSLQVLVENAVKHGIATSEQGGEIRIHASREDAMLILEVQDPGMGISKHQGTGTALDTLRQRLSNPEDLKLEPTPQGVCATLRWRIA